MDNHGETWDNNCEVYFISAPPRGRHRAVNRPGARPMRGMGPRSERMLTKEENEMLTRVGKGTPMSAFFPAWEYDVTEEEFKKGMAETTASSPSH
jgi:hypothetical protein